MSQSFSKPVHTVMIVPEKLASFYLSVADNLTKSGIASDQLNEIMAGHVFAECVACGLRFGGEELGQLAVGQNDPSNQKFSRLRLGYCGRNGCDAKLYNVHFTFHPLVNWKTISDPVENTSEHAQPAPSPAAPVTGRSSYQKLAFRLCLVLAALYIVVYVTRIYTEGRIPLLQPKHVYAVDPNSAKELGK